MRRIALLAVLLTATVLPGQVDPKKALAELKGVWILASAEAQGKKLAAEDIKDFRVTIAENGEFTVRHGNEESKGKLTIDVTKKPRTIDLFFETGPNKGKAQRGIYELQNEQLRICAGDVDKERPTVFATKATVKTTLWVFRK